MFKILVVENDCEMSHTVCAFLNQSGYEATGCPDANEAYDAMYENVFDLIISDIMMPDIDGFEFAKMVRSLNNEIPILFVTVRNDFASKQRGYRVGIDDYMVKAIDLDEFFLRIGALLRRSRLCGFILLTVNLFLSGAVLMIIYRNKGYEYHGILIYIMAMYTFYIDVILRLIKHIHNHYLCNTMLVKRA